jgi:hypothetical protein
MVPASLRRWHSYIGLFIAPSVLFFSLTGALQIFDFHEAHGTYQPWVLIEKLAALHRDQVFERPHEHDAPPENQAEPQAPPAPGPKPEADEDKTSVATLALKWFFFAIALGLAGSTCVGMWMGLNLVRPRARAWALLLAGALAPVILLLI